MWSHATYIVTLSPLLLRNSIVTEHLRESPKLWRYYYRRAFREVFAEAEEDAFWVRTRLGRAMKLYDEGLHLPELHAFLSMCLVLETLFTVDHGELMHKMATRLAKIVAVADSPKSRLDLYNRCKDLYEKRGLVVHGSTLIDQVDEKLRKDAFELCRLAIRRVLCDPRLRDVCADPTTRDKGSGQKRENVKRLREFFRDIDLGMAERGGEDA